MLLRWVLFSTEIKNVNKRSLDFLAVIYYVMLAYVVNYYHATPNGFTYSSLWLHSHCWVCCVPSQILLLRVLIKVCCVSVRVTLHVCVFVLQSEQLMCRMLICLYVYFSVSIVLIKFNFNLMCF